jgi:hypothetical protein
MLSLQVARGYAARGLHPPVGLSVAQALLDFTLQYSLHAVVLLVVLMTPDMWSSPVYYLFAANGMIITNWSNLRAMCKSPYAAWLQKLSRSALQELQAHFSCKRKLL